MDTKRIYDAQLSVSRIINADLINDLVSRLSAIGPDKYDYNSKSVVINKDGIPDELDDINIKYILKEWIYDMNLNKEDYNTLINNIDILFNITKITLNNNLEHIINVYLY